MKQNTPEWLEMRKKCIGASDAPIIMGVSPYKTPYQLWEEKSGLREPPPMSSSMKHGHEIEQHARDMYALIKGIRTEPVVLFDMDRKWMMASLDGVSKCGQHAIEIKRANKHDHELARQGLIPEKYYPQLQHQMQVGCWKSIDYVSIGTVMEECGEYDTQIITVPRDQDYIDDLIPKLEIFEYKLRAGIAPELCDRDFVEISDNNWLGMCEAYNHFKKQKYDAEAMMESIKIRMIEASYGRNAKGCGLMLYKSIRKGNVMYDKIPQLKDLDLEQYRKPSSEVWTIREKKDPVSE